MLLFAGGLVLAAVAPPWLTQPLHRLVTSAGAWAPVVYVALNALLAPLHLNGVLIVLSPLIWPLPQAAALSYGGSLLGSALTWWVLSRAGAGPATQRDGWPGWLERLAADVQRRPYLVGTVVRLILHSGLALESFYLLTGYTRRQYLVVTAVGIALWVVQAFLGVTVLAAALDTSVWIGVLAIAVPLLVVGGLLARQRRRTHAAR